MRSAAEDAFTSLAIALAVTTLGAGCAADPGAAVPPARPAAQPAAPAGGSELVRIVGLLTRKGPDVEAWWALTDDRGVVWRLEPATADQAREFQQWQNRRIGVDGTRAGMVLATPRIRVERVLPMP